MRTFTNQTESNYDEINFQSICEFEESLDKFLNATLMIFNTSILNFRLFILYRCNVTCFT